MPDRRNVRVHDGLVSSVLEVLGLVLLVVSAWVWAPLAGVAASGVVLVALGVALGVRTRL